MLPIASARRATGSARAYLWQALLWAALGLLAYGLAWMINLANVQSALGWFGFVIAAVGGAVFGVVLVWQVRQLRYLTPSQE